MTVLGCMVLKDYQVKEDNVVDLFCVGMPPFFVHHVGRSHSCLEKDTLDLPQLSVLTLLPVSTFEAMLMPIPPCMLDFDIFHSQDMRQYLKGLCSLISKPRADFISQLS